MATPVFRFKDQFGRVIMDLAQTSGKAIGVVQTSYPTAGSVTNAAFASGIPFWTIINTTTATGGSKPPTISISGNTLSWSWPAGYDAYMSPLIVYGTY